MKKHLLVIAIAAVFLSCSDERSSKVIQAAGIVEAREIIVSSEISGKVIKINFDEGSKVDSGFVLCQIDTELAYQRYLEAKFQAEALLSQYRLLLKGVREEEIEIMNEVVNRARVNFENAQKQLERVSSLYEAGVVTPEQLDNARAFFESSKSQYEEAVKKLEILRKGVREEEIRTALANYERAVAQMRAIKIQIERARIVSPISGFVVEKFIELGEFVSPGTPIAKIADLNEVYIRIYVSEKELGLVKINDTVNVRIDSYPNRIFKGVIIFVSSKAEFTPKNIQTKDERVKLTYAVKVKVKNEEWIFKSGMPADVEIIK